MSEVPVLTPGPLLPGQAARSSRAARHKEMPPHAGVTSVATAVMGQPRKAPFTVGLICNEIWIIYS